VSYTQTDVDQLKKAIASGARVVHFKDHRTEFRTLDEMQQTLATMEREVMGTKRITRTIAAYSDGC